MSALIILVRHGQTEWNRIERFRGHYDIPLNKTGLEQSQKTAKFIHKYWRPTAIYSSPLSRAMQTANCIAKTCGLIVHPAERLIDIDYGKWQGLTPEEVKKQWPEPLNNWYENPEIAQIPRGETPDQVQNRAVSALSEICWLHNDQQIVLVSHTVVIRLILLDVLGLKINRFWHLKQEPCAVNVIENSGKEYTLVSMNNFWHTY